MCEIIGIRWLGDVKFVFSGDTQFVRSYGNTFSWSAFWSSTALKMASGAVPKSASEKCVSVRSNELGQTKFQYIPVYFVKISKFPYNSRIFRGNVKIPVYSRIYGNFKYTWPPCCVQLYRKKTDISEQWASLIFSQSLNIICDDVSWSFKSENM